MKAKGLSFGENQAGYHFWNATEELLRQAEEEMEARAEELRQEMEAVAYDG